MNVGFLSLEEIDETEYGLEIPSTEAGNRKVKEAKQSTKLKKQKRGSDNGSTSEAKVAEETKEEAKVEEKLKKDENVNAKKKKKNKNKKKKANDKENETRINEEFANG